MSVTPEEALVTKALAATGLTALIGDRIYREVAWTKNIKYPIVVTSIEESNSLSALNTVGGWVQAKIAFWIWAEDQRDVVPIAEQLRLALHCKKENVTVGTTTVKPTILLDSEESSSKVAEDGSEKLFYGIKQIYSVGMAQA